MVMYNVRQKVSCHTDRGSTEPHRHNREQVYVTGSSSTHRARVCYRKVRNGTLI